jgi:hypothetical protein
MQNNPEKPFRHIVSYTQRDSETPITCLARHDRLHNLLYGPLRERSQTVGCIRKKERGDKKEKILTVATYWAELPSHGGTRVER